MLLNYLPVLVYMIICIGLIGVIVLLSELLGKKKHFPAKDLPYECGMDPIGDAMFFIVFDIEAIFLYPWAVIFKLLGWFGFWEMLVFIAVLVVGLVYVWGRGALEWE
jgi:NADH-quinone oxidoreductase subunit A